MSEERGGSEVTRRQERDENYLSGVLTISFGEFFQETEVSHYNLEFQEPGFENFDRQEFRVMPRIGMNVGDRTQALVEYGLTRIDFDRMTERNGWAHEGSLGVRGFLGQGD